jgi:UDP-glucose 4-epimerase
VTNDARPSTLAGKTVLVTGGAGLVGRALVRTLLSDPDAAVDVRVLDRFRTTDPAALPDAVDVFRGDVRDRRLVERALDGASVVFHQAATSGRRPLDDPVESHGINSTATLHLLDRARAEGARVIVASSAAIYAPPASVPIREDAPKDPPNPYGLQKLSADGYARLSHDLYGLETVVLRYFNVYGYRPDDSRHKSVVNVFLERARDGKDLVLEDGGTQIRDFIHVDDVVRANLQAATTSAVGEAFNVGTGVGTTIEELAELVRDRETDVAITATEGRRADVEASVADVSNARERLGFRSSVTLSEGLAALRSRYQ